MYISKAGYIFILQDMYKPCTSYMIVSCIVNMMMYTMSLRHGEKYSSLGPAREKRGTGDEASIP